MSNRRSRIHAQLLCGAASAALILSAGAAQARDDKRISIPPQALASALHEFGVQSGHQVLFKPSATDSKASPGADIDGDMDAALAQLLAGTGMSFRRAGDVFLIQEGGSSPQSASAGGDVEALIVTAQKREENIQDVPIAISAFSQEDLTRSQVAGGPDLITQVPNMTFTKTNFSSYSVQLRGIGTQAISATTDPAVAVAFNNTPFIRNRFFEQEFYDLQRVEVLRGPQGTLYGRNATAGVVNLISAKPKFAYEARASADVSNYASSRIEGMVNIPLVEDVVALRLAGAWTKRDGYATNATDGAPIDGRDLWSTRLSLRMAPNDRLEANLIWEHFQENDDRLRSGKQLCKKDVVFDIGGVPITNYYSSSVSGGQLGTLFAGDQAVLSQGCKPNSLYANDSFQRPNGLMLPYYLPLGAIGLPTALNDPYVSPVLGNNPNFVDPALVDATNDQPEDWRVIESTVAPEYLAKSDIAELQIRYDLTDGLTLSSETAYGVDFVYSLEDFNRFNTAPGAWRLNPTLINRGILDANGMFCDPQLGCSDRLVAVDVSTAKARQFSQEFRLSSDFDGPFNFSLGANFLRADSEDKYYVFINSLSLIAATGGRANEQWEYGQTDNVDCLANGPRVGDPNKVYAVAGCVYIDPNPVGSVNDEGHNYFLSKNPYRLISYATFGEAYYNITPALKVTAGLRLTVDKKEAPRIPTWILASNTVGYPVAEIIRQEWNEPTGRLAIDWKPDLSFTDETLLYASYAHGYKAGGANPPGFVRVYYSNSDAAKQQTQDSATRPKTFEPEFVDAFELGTKNTLLDGRLTLNANAFYYDYKSYQVSEIVDRSAFNRNFDAEVWGAELEAEWRPLENLRLGLKGGYEKTRIADGEEAIDLMDRTAGHVDPVTGEPDWLVVRPFPTFASSCILPTYVYVNPNNTIGYVGGVGGGGPGPCEVAYSYGADPVYGVPNVTADTSVAHPGYPGFDPSTAPNNGEGFTKPLGGNELPNAPNWTWTITGDYTLPLAGDWLATLHTDLHWQSESWWRVFNDHEYDKLDEYFTMNLAAIFTNEEAGWKVMAYVKNVTDETAITGAFLNSDDTGLTTNIFLTEPRLYGVRITKEWTGGGFLGNLFDRGARDPGKPYPLTVTIGGQVQRWDAPNEMFLPSFTGQFGPPLDIFATPQSNELDWGDGRDVEVTYRPGGGGWSLAAGLRFGKTNNYGRAEAQQDTDRVCGLAGTYYSFVCDKYGDPDWPEFQNLTNIYQTNWASARATQREDFEIADFTVGRDVGLGGFSRSTISGGLRYAQLKSSTTATFNGVPDWDIPEEGLKYPFPGLTSTRSEYQAEFEAQRTFKGVGPVISWDAAHTIADFDTGGRFDLAWDISGGVLFGDRETTVAASEIANAFELTATEVVTKSGILPDPLPLPSPPPIDIRRSQSVTVPLLGASLGLSYEVDRFKIGAGYRWERYFDAIDGGIAEERSYDRTIDGPYFKVSVGFGG